MITNNDWNTGTRKVYNIIVFDLRKKSEKLKSLVDKNRFSRKIVAR